MVRDGETGFLLGVGDVEGMADAAVDLLSDNARWQAASTRAARDARERFSQTEIVRKYEEFYTYALSLPSVLKRRKASALTSAASR